MLKKTLSPLYISNFEIFPSKLFDGAFVRTSIVLGGLQENASRRFMTKLFRWYSIERSTLIDGLVYQELFQEEEKKSISSSRKRYCREDRPL